MASANDTSCSPSGSGCAGDSQQYDEAAAASFRIPSQATPARQLLEPLNAHKRLRLVLEVLPAWQPQLAPRVVGRRRL